MEIAEQILGVLKWTSFPLAVSSAGKTRVWGIRYPFRAKCHLEADLAKRAAVSRSAERDSWGAEVFNDSKRRRRRIRGTTHTRLRCQRLQQEK